MQWARWPASLRARECVSCREGGGREGALGAAARSEVELGVFGDGGYVEEMDGALGEGFAVR